MTTKADAYLAGLDLADAIAEAEQEEAKALTPMTIQDTASIHRDAAACRAQQWKFVEKLWDRVVELESRVKP